MPSFFPTPSPCSTPAPRPDAIHVSQHMLPQLNELMKKYHDDVRDKNTSILTSYPTPSVTPYKISTITPDPTPYFPQHYPSSATLNIGHPISFNYINQPYHLGISLTICPDCENTLMEQLANDTKITLKTIMYILPALINNLDRGFATRLYLLCPHTSTINLIKDFQSYKGQMSNIDEVNGSYKDQYMVETTLYITNSQRITLLKQQFSSNGPSALRAMQTTYTDAMRKHV